MTPAERILLRLDALECLGVRVAPVRPAPAVELPAIIREGATFGSILGQQTVAELQDIVTSWAYRMKQLGDAFTAFAPRWQTVDPTGYGAWLADWNALQTRYGSALAGANAAITAAKLNVFVPNSAIPAQGPYDALMKAMRQCYPPDGCPTAQGDFDDLNNRFTAVARTLGGTAPSYANMPQPTATDLDQQAFAATAPVDIVAQVTGQEKPKLPGMDGAASTWAWLIAHEKEILIGGAVVLGGLLLLELLPVLALPLKAAKAVTALGVAA